MALKTTAIHADPAKIKRLDAWAKKLRRSRNSLINEGIDDLLERLATTSTTILVPVDRKPGFMARQHNKQNGKVAATR